MPSGVSAGHETTLLYYWEDNGFAQSPTDSTPKNFGADPTVGTTEGRNALRRVFEPGTRTGIDQIAVNFDGRITINFVLTNPWWLRTILGKPGMVDNGDGSFTYTYSIAEDGTPDTIQVVEGHEQSGKERVIKGVLITEASIDVQVEGEAQVSLTGAYADEEITSPASLTTQPSKDYDPMTFVDGSVSIGGTTEAYVQSMGLTLTNNVDPIREMGTSFFVDYNPKTLEPSVNLTDIFDGDHDSLEALFGGSGETSPLENRDENQAVVDMAFDNGNTAGSGINKGSFDVSGTLQESYDEAGIGDPRADLEETINRPGLEPTIEWTNEISSEP
jgi:hypothetical protein